MCLNGVNTRWVYSQSVQKPLNSGSEQWPFERPFGLGFREVPGGKLRPGTGKTQVAAAVALAAAQGLGQASELGSPRSTCGRRPLRHHWNPRSPQLGALLPSFQGGFPYENRLQNKVYPYSNLSTGGPRIRNPGV